MKTTFLTTVAVAALALSVGTAHAQSNERGGAAPGGAMERNAPVGMERGAPGDRNSGAVEQSPSKAGAAQNPAGSAKTDMKAEGKSGEKNAQAPAANKMGSDKAAPDNSAQRTGDAKQAPADSKSGTKAESPSKTTVGAAPASETKMTTEQRTQIREKVIATGPKVTNVNFSLSVGTVVPRTVVFAEVPTVIIDIHPEWRGYRYFVVNDQIIIIERDSFRIVAVMSV